jgi:hypothetical protein
VRSLRADSIAAAGLVAAISVAFTEGVSAHRGDEYLQAVRIAVAPDRVHLELNLTPGIAVADVIIREIDRNDDGVLSPNEQQAYARRVLDGTSLEVDDARQSLPLDVVASSFPDINAMRNGDGTIAIQSDVAVPLLPAGPHRLFFRNRNATPEHHVYLANALMPENDRVAVTGQRRNQDQSDLTLDFVVRGTAAASSRRWVWINLGVGLVLFTPLIRRTRLRLA